MSTSRSMARFPAPTILALLAIAGIGGPAGVATAKPGDDETVGTWSFATDRPVKAVVVGGSVAEFPGGFAEQLQGACKNVEIVNLAKARLGAAAIKARFDMQVLQNPNLSKGWGGTGERWTLVMGGLNSVGNPEQTNLDVLGIYRDAHGAGLKVLGLTLGPWGDESDKRWAGFAGIRRQDNTRKACDFTMGRLTPAQALGKKAAGLSAWQPGDLPDVSVDLYDSELRDRDADPRPEGPLAARIDSDPDVKATIEDLTAEKRAAERARILAQAREIPRWYLRKDLRAFDHIHPNKDGHRIIATRICAKAPASWGCDCALLAPASKR